ncbi:hypothetical protein WISP_68253 [Willisornis vidua]|uniref:Uncharacterized protein n=1 Tax=Willisornis vidua TaxID=1566151 RepID=A0ABQ9D8A0_9PASS|nr:hypothetical protein WISP_68253 [Willisornis vidua]
MEKEAHREKVPGRTCEPVGGPHWSRLILKDCTLQKGPMLTQFVKNCSLCKELTLEKFPWERSHTGARVDYEKSSPEAEVAETAREELTTAPTPCVSVPLGDGGRGNRSEIKPGKKGGVRKGYDKLIASEESINNTAKGMVMIDFLHLCIAPSTSDRNEKGTKKTPEGDPAIPEVGGQIELSPEVGSEGK